MNQAVALDPLVAGRYRQRAQYMRNLGRYNESLVDLAKSLDLNPDEVWAHETRGEVYLVQGRPREALTEMEKEPAGCLHDLGMALAFHDLGRHQESEAVLADFISQDRAACAYQIAEVYAYREEADQAFDWLNRAYRQHDDGLCRIKTDPLLRFLRADPRYVQMLRTLDIPNQG